MRLTRRHLRNLIEAEVDKMRLPRGPNSRDDAEDKPLDESSDLVESVLNEEIDPVYDMINGWATRLRTALDVLDSDLVTQDGYVFVTSEVYEAMDEISALNKEMKEYAKIKDSM